ncbi:zinc-finger double domain-containing protein [Sarocladium implicatum]|nr:zinc-finger double domain-containing protein [Sarocladium implicatum]
MRSPAPGEVMDITTMLNNKGGMHHQQALPGHLPLIKADPIMERSVSPHGSEHSHYSAHSLARSYSSQGLSGSMPMHGMPTSIPLPGYPDMHGMNGMSNIPMHGMPQGHDQPSPPLTKAYACGTCGKGFARRSDLARHERIHSGDKPHFCDFKGCGKTFIQRSALTVHQRTHTGEKPHHCETCAKKFGDSSSLARHRRTHSGKRPYKCPFADCQKTFTRRTTLTRHQNHHTGTIEEAAAATAAALAASNHKAIPRSEADHLSAHGSPMTTPSPAQRTMSMSPSVDLSGSGLARHPQEFQYLQQSGSLPVHMRVGSPASTTSAGYTTSMRPTSHPTSYGPPPTLEPNLEQHQSGPGSANGSAAGSPHMSSMGWQSPSHMPSPSHNGAHYGYPETDYSHNPAMSHMFYGATHMRRPQSAEPGMVHM